MPAQTSNVNILIPDGCKVEVKEYGAGSYTDLGAVLGDCTASMTWTENKIEFANAEAIKSIKEMKVEGGFELANFVSTNIEKISNGILSETTTAASANSSIPDQTIAADWSDNTLYELIMYTSSTDSSKLRMATQPALTSVTLDPGTTDEALEEDTEYVVVEDSNSYSGWSIQFISGNMSTEDPTDYTIGIVYDSNTPVAASVLSAGSSSLTANPYSLKFSHTDSSSLVRQLEIFSATTQSGGIQFNFKSVTDSGVESIPVTFMGEIDTDLTDGQQLLQWTQEVGAA